MSNKAIIKSLKLLASLMELHDANNFKIKIYTGAIFQIEKTEQALAGLDKAGLAAAGFTEGMAEKIQNLIRQGTLPELDELKQKTPQGIVEMLGIKGLGAKKVKTLWQELGVESIHELAEACQAGKVAAIKGFGEKTQASILKEIAYRDANQRKLHYADAAPIATEILKALTAMPSVLQASTSGELRRQLEVIETLRFVLATENTDDTVAQLSSLPMLHYRPAISSPFIWRGYWQAATETEQAEIAVEIRFTKPHAYVNTLFADTANPLHLSKAALKNVLRQKNFSSEEEIYQHLQMPYLVPELREGLFEFDLIAQGEDALRLVELSDLKGSLHNHSTYSDGIHSLKEMAEACIEMGLSYFGICDHSQSAFYANGLSAERVKQQHREIDQLNQTLAPFKIFKGIESDILHDGSLDYPDEVLASFDFVVASVHSGLQMDIHKATQRLIKAIQNPFTNILGHPTGRLLLRREGYPIDHKAVIDACAEYGVVIELNANPWRLDLDWRWLQYAISRGVLISINPDAHEKSGLHDMEYGVITARKGGALPKHIFNTKSAEEVADFFVQHRQKSYIAP